MRHLARSFSNMIFTLAFLLSNTGWVCAQSYNVVQKKGEIYPIAGTGAASYTGDGNSALFAGFNTPTGIAIDGDGNLYIADSKNHVIRRIEAETGVISTIAGTGIQGFSSDGGTATETQLDLPTYIGVSKRGDLYISDTGNHRLRKVLPSGVMSTVHGNPDLIPGQIAIDDLTGMVYFTDRGSSTRKDNLHIISSILRIFPSGDVTTFLETPTNYSSTLFYNDIDRDALGNVFLLYGWGFSDEIARFNGRSGTKDSIFCRSARHRTIEAFALSEPDVYYAEENFSRSLPSTVIRYGKIDKGSGFQDFGIDTIGTYTGEVSDLAIDKEGNVIFANKADNKIYRITNRKGFEPDIEFPKTFSMGELVMGSTKTKSLRLSNIGNMRLSILNISSQIPSLAIQPKSADIESGDSASVSLTIEPERSGEITGAITVLNTDPDQANVSIPLLATAFTARIDLDLERGPENQNNHRLKGVTAGDTITVQIFGSDMPTLAGFQVSLQYDTAFISAESLAFENGTLIPNALTVITHTEASVTASAAAPGEVSSQNRTDLMGTLNFVILDNFSQPDSTSIDLTDATLSLNDGTLVEVERQGSISLSSESQLTGDFDGDSSVGFSDFLKFAQVFGKRSADADYDAKFDLNDDGMIGFSDFLIFAASFGSTG